MGADATATFLIALWGAVTGTVAVAVQIAHHFSDRGRLDISASMSQTVDRVNPKSRLKVEVELCNTGRRPITVEQVGIILPNEKKPDANVQHARTFANLFDASSAGKFLQLHEGQKQMFRVDPFPQKWGRALYEQGATAKAFAKITSGKERVASFYLINPAKFPPE